MLIFNSKHGEGAKVRQKSGQKMAKESRGCLVPGTKREESFFERWKWATVIKTQ